MSIADQPYFLGDAQFAGDYADTRTPEQIAEAREEYARHNRSTAIAHAANVHLNSGACAEFIIEEAEKLLNYIESGSTKKTPVDLRPVKQED